MAQPKLVTCKYCKKKIEKEKAFSDKPRSYFCNKEHFNAWIESHRPKRKCYVCQTETNNSVLLFKHWICNDCLSVYKKSEEFAKEDLLDFLWNLYPKESQDTALFYTLKTQIEKYHKEYDFNYKAMKVAISYYIKVLEYKWNPHYGIGQVFPKGYYIAAEYYETRRKLKHKLSGHLISNTTETVKGIKNKNLKPLLPLD